MQQSRFPGGTLRAVADQQVAADGNRYHHEPSFSGDSVSPGSLGVSLGVQDIGDYLCRLPGRRGHDRGPHLDLQLRGAGVDLP